MVLTRVMLSLVAAATLASVRGQAPADYLRQAAAMIERHETEQAVQILARGLQAFPTDPELLTRLGHLLVTRGNLEEGDQLLSRALALRPLDRQALQGRAEVRLREGDLSEAAALFERALAQRSRDAATRYRLAYTRFAQGRDEEALLEARRAVEQAPLNAAHRRLYALFLRLRRQPEESSRQLRMAHDLDPTNVETLSALSQQEWEVGNRERAVELAERAVQLDPENPLGYRTLSRLYEQSGRGSDAARAEAAWLRLREGFDLYLQALGETGTESPEVIAGLVEEALRRAPELTTARIYLAALYSRQGRDEEALELYSQVLDQDSSQPTALAESARIRLSQGSVAEALSTLEDSPGENDNLELLRGYQAMQDQDFAGALSHFERARANNPLLPGLLQLIAFCLSALGQTEKALENLDLASRVAPGRGEIETQAAEVRLEQARSLQAQGKLQDAVAAYEALLDTTSPDPEVRLHLAYCYQQLGRLEKAASQYRMGLEARPEADWARANLAAVLTLQQKYALAASEWRILSRRQPRAASFHQLGLCLGYLGRHPEAEQAYEKALSLGDDSPRLLFDLGSCRLRLNRPEMAWPVIEKAARAGYLPALQMIRQARRGQ